MRTPSNPDLTVPPTGDPLPALLGGDAARLRRVLAWRRRPNSRVPSWRPRQRNGGSLA